MAQFGTSRFSALCSFASWPFLHSRVAEMAGQCWKGEIISHHIAKAAGRECRHI
uniref:Uncharacterized protein n=1 Tax=Arundo donax TaxID=35708 RepID=A0A0A8ZHP7_ARUDO